MQKLEDGTYQVTYGSICAAFVVEKGKITQIAPILRDKIQYWITIAKKID